MLIILLNFILVNNKLSLYNGIWVIKAHLHAKSGSLQGCPWTKLERDESWRGRELEDEMIYGDELGMRESG